MGAQDARTVLEFTKLELAADTSANIKTVAGMAGQALRLSFSPHRSFKKLLLPEFGGGHAVANHYLTHVSQSATCEVVRALAEERLFILQHLSHIFTDIPKSGKNPGVVCITLEGLIRTLQYFQALSRTIKNPGRDPQRDTIFEQCYGRITLRTAVCMATATGVSPQLCRQTIGAGGKHKRERSPTPNTPHDHPPKAPKGNPARPGGKGTHPRNDRRPNNDRPPPPRTKDCPNCRAAGKPGATHSLTQCKEMGNNCVLKCNRCDPTTPHWHVDCKAPSPPADKGGKGGGNKGGK